jgi:DNA-binding response OmpR family regulator
MAKIMIVDDDEQASNLLGRVVRMNGHESMAVNKSTEAVETAYSFNPDLFLLDLMMPGINGYELCELLRADSKFATTPIIIVSALEDKVSKAKAFNAGASEYISKPFNIIELAERINTLLSQHKVISN